MKAKYHIALHGWALFGFWWAVFQDPIGPLMDQLLGFYVGLMAGVCQIVLMAVTDKIIYGAVRIFGPAFAGKD